MNQNLDHIPDEQVIRDRIDILFMKRTHLWPNDFLYLKRLRAGRNPSDFNATDLGLLFKDTRKENVQYRYIFVPEPEIPFKPDFSRARAGGDELILMLVEEGWLVD